MLTPQAYPIWSGTGIATDPYRIATTAQLVELATYTSASSTTTGNYVGGIVGADAVYDGTTQTPAMKVITLGGIRAVRHFADDGGGGGGRRIGSRDREVSLVGCHDRD